MQDHISKGKKDIFSSNFVFLTLGLTKSGGDRMISALANYYANNGGKVEIFVTKKSTPYYKLDKNTRRLIKNDISLELTEKEIELIELLNKKSFTKKKEILSEIWKYSDDAETHTVETHIYRLRKKIKEMFNDDNFIKSEKKGYTI